MFKGKNILLGITGGIAAYKSTFLVRLLVKAGANVQVVMTTSAGSFVSPLTLATLSKNPVLTSYVKEEGPTTDWNNHVELGLWAHMVLIAPATANTLAKMANGVCDNLLLGIYLSAKCPVFFAPAMDLDMYRHPSTKVSLEKLKTFGNIIIPPTSGELASGLHGEGRMAEPGDIVEKMRDYLALGLPLRDKKVLITAGPTHEALDPVRFIGNRSTGAMGFEIAHAAADLGAEVVLVSGPTQLEMDHPQVRLIRVVSAEEMYQVVHEHYGAMDIVICAAAVGDYRPKTVADQKIKKKGDILTLELVRNKDILLSLGQHKKGQYLVGFALETENELENAKGKLQRKNLDAIILNSLNDEGAGFGTQTNKITFLDKKSGVVTFDVKKKAQVALDILNEVIQRVHA
ncbi:MAG: bifunctional phosphopantothenoylcysteine decarboxylase/phosphopantothenate--cysteine ligase CoaBC [Bacteroidota bacterium]